MQFEFDKGNVALYLGVVEKIWDPLKMGRVRVRVFGIHTEIKKWAGLKGLPVEKLWWAMPMFPVQSPTIDQLCDFQVPKQGSIVLCTFLDPYYQKLVYLGTMPRIPLEKPRWSKGFSDPDGEHPNLLGESPISRLARNEKIGDTIIPLKRERVRTGVDCNGITWDEPPTEYNTQYTKNRVIHTEEHRIEIDDTPGYERIHFWHGAETCDEYFPNGDKVEWINNNKYTIIVADNNVKVEGNNNIHIDSDNNIHIYGNSNIKVDGNTIIDVGGNIEATAGGNVEVTAGGNIEATASGSASVTASSASVTAGSIDLNGTIACNGATTINGTLTVNGLTTFNGTVKKYTTTIH